MDEIDRYLATVSEEQFERDLVASHFYEIQSSPIVFFNQMKILKDPNALRLLASELTEAHNRYITTVFPKIVALLRDDDWELEENHLYEIVCESLPLSSSPLAVEQVEANIRKQLEGLDGLREEAEIQAEIAKLNGRLEALRSRR